MYLEEMKTGMSVTIENVTVDKDEMLDFALTYNPAKVHTDEEYAKSTRFGKLLAPGMYTFMAVWRKYIPLDFGGEEFIAGKSTSLEWLAPVFAGDVLSCKAQIADISYRNPYNGILTVSFDIFNAEGTLVLKADVESIVKRAPAK